MKIKKKNLIKLIVEQTKLQIQETRRRTNQFVFGMAGFIHFWKKNPDFYENEILFKEMMDSKLNSDDVFQLSAFFKIPGMNKSQVLNGQLIKQINFSMFNGIHKDAYIKKAKVLEKIVRFLDEQSGGDPGFIRKFSHA